MINNDAVLGKIAEALLVDYTSVYYVNAVTNEYRWYSVDPEFHSLGIGQEGTDFFVNLIRDADKVVYEEDKHIFMHDIQKERLLGEMKKGTMQSLVYRLVIDGRPVYHTLRLIRGLSSEDDYFILGVLNIDKQVREREEQERLTREREFFNQIAESLASHYDTLYYIDSEDNSYTEFSSTDIYRTLGVPVTGDDFFTESAKNLKKYVHPDDQSRVLGLFRKETILNNLKDKKTFTAEYRLMVADRIMHVRCSQIWASDKKHIILCIENINDEVSTQHALMESRRRSVTYGQIAESLASHYDVIYYVDSSNGEYVRFTDNISYDDEDTKEVDRDFFACYRRDNESLVHPEDRERVFNELERDHLITVLEDKEQHIVEFRFVINDNVRYSRLSVMWSNDRTHFIISIENINEEIKKKRQQVQALNMANELARKDELTGTRNKNAYHEFESSLQENIDSGTAQAPFAIVVCDINDLKFINDTKGHKAGDEYIRSACRLICNVFSHSPVFRVGGDEFVAVLANNDYTNRDALLEKLRKRTLDNLTGDKGPVVASGMAVFDPEKDRKVSEVFERADSMMYEEKKHLKEGSFIGAPSEQQSDSFEPVPEERKRKLDELFDAFSIVAEGTYVYLCDMRYDYSRWSANAVDAFGLPSEYMYGAGAVWEEHIHPEDRETYHSGIDDVFSGKASGHDMQYRACRINGEYDICTCKGIVIRDKNGEPEYFGGAIRNHGVQGHVDPLTGLSNQYGFFEDLQTTLIKNKNLRAVLIGISKFSEINEIYGYHFGNTVLQRFGRYLFEHVGNSGGVYRLDGTKFAVLSDTLSVDDIKDRYDYLRIYFRERFVVEDKSIMLDLNAGVIDLVNFSVDHQTVYACMAFAYGESKLRRQGDLVEFYNDLNDENKHRIEKLHAIRASIMQGYHGFYLLYQPVVDSRTEKLIGAEALLRWKSDEYGTVPPDHFIPLLERDTLFPELGEWILRRAITDAKTMIKEDPEFIMNVNLSYTQLEKPDFVDMVLGTLRENDYPPENLCLEITERCRLLDMELLKNVIVNLRGRGVQIALDDFGTGFSSIGVVKNLPFDIIKIDRSFVRKIEEDEKERELIRSFAGVASTFGARVCIEGVETSGMRDILQNYSVHSFQGYYYAKPLSFEDFRSWNGSKDN